jgi:hypothetical protein
MHEHGLLFITCVSNSLPHAMLNKIRTSSICEWTSLCIIQIILAGFTMDALRFEYSLRRENTFSEDDSLT